MNKEKKDKLPEWLKVKAPGGKVYREVKGLVNDLGLHTVCQSARCPNIGSCWDRKTATFMILGDKCTRDCGFCGVSKGPPEESDPGEAERVASAVAKMDLRYAVITSVTRDDLPDGGSELFARTIDRIREKAPGCRIEVLIPDFRGDKKSLELVLNSVPDVLAHNIETVPRLYEGVRPGADYKRSLELLKQSKLLSADVLTKSGIMVGLGESTGEVVETMKDLKEVSVDLFTIGQYLRPTRHSLPIDRYVHPDEFKELERVALSLGFKGVSSGPLVRSSYFAEEQAADELGKLM
jgi:lipoic acid synthetase